jgi:hypothetical protein
MVPEMSGQVVRRLCLRSRLREAVRTVYSYHVDQRSCYLDHPPERWFIFCNNFEELVVQK